MESFNFIHNSDSSQDSSWSVSDKIETNGFEEVRLVSIPTIITTVSFSPPAKFKKHTQSIEKYMPEWTHIILDKEKGERFIKTNWSDIWPLYNKLRFRKQKINLLKFLWLSQYGGVIIDQKYNLRQAIDRLFYNESHLYFHSLDLMASTPNHNFWMDVIDEMEKRVKDKPWWGKSKEKIISRVSGEDLINDCFSKTSYSVMILPKKGVDSRDECHSAASYDLLENSDMRSWIGDWCKCHKTGLIWTIVIIVVILIIAILILCIFNSKKKICDSEKPMINGSHKRTSESDFPIQT